MIWLVWRRLRVPLLVVFGLVAVVVAAAVIGRITSLSAARDLGVEQCLGGSTAGVCGTDVWYGFRNGRDGLQNLLTLAAMVLPGAAGGIVGAALFGTETSRGTHVLALSQGLSRRRWWGTGLLVAGLPVAVVVALVPPVLAWAVDPFDDLFTGGPLSAGAFVTSGVVPVAYAVLAFCAAATAGLLLRSTVGALGIAVGLHLVLLIAVALLARPVYLPPETVRAALPAPEEFVDWGEPTGSMLVETGYVDAQGREVSERTAERGPCDDAYSDCLRAEGFTGLYARYHPVSRYWPFQAIESALLLALAGGALGAGLWGLRRRVH